MSSYYPTSPQSSEDPRVSQGRLLSNFGKLNTDFSINHSALTTSLNAGYHTKIQFPTGLGADPGLNDPQSSLYPKIVSGLAQLFFQNDVGASNVFQLTGISTTTSGSNYSFLTPWKLRIQMGVATVSPTSFDTPFDPGFILMTAVATPISGSA